MINNKIFKPIIILNLILLIYLNIETVNAALFFSK